jgi:hypothetical protein
MLLMKVARSYKPGENVANNELTRGAIHRTVVSIARGVQCRPQFHIKRCKLNCTHRILDRGGTKPTGFISVWSRGHCAESPAPPRGGGGGAVSVRRDYFALSPVFAGIPRTTPHTVYLRMASSEYRRLGIPVRPQIDGKRTLNVRRRRKVNWPDVQRLRIGGFNRFPGLFDAVIADCAKICRGWLLD